jgi:LuxR family maltose regulon positive regulatory protein
MTGYIVDYLLEEVLERQSAEVRNFLLQTSILDRLTGPLCDAVTGQESGKTMLEALERGNLFVVALDDKRRWYRYHQLFADVLQARLMEEQADRAPVLHRRASEWYARHDQASDAIRHALAARDFERAAGLVERVARATIKESNQSARLLDWVKMLPADLVRVRPVLSTYYAFGLLGMGEVDAAAARLSDAERWLDATRVAPAFGMVVEDQEEFRSLPGTIALARSFHAQALGDVAGTVEQARQALNLLPKDDHVWRGGAALLLALAHWTSGDLEAAQQTHFQGIASLEKAGAIALAISAAYDGANLAKARGRLSEAGQIYDRSLRLALAHGAPELPGVADLHLGLSELHLEKNDLEAATKHLHQSEAPGLAADLRETPYRRCVARARLRQAQGDLDGALGLLDEAERLYVRSVVPDIRPLAALKARVWVVQNRVAEALDWADRQGLSVDDDLAYMREFEHLTLARALIARGARAVRDARRLLERLLEAAEQGGRTGAVIGILVLQALAHRALDDIPGGLVALDRALTLAEPEGYVRIFVDEGMAMRNLLRHAVAKGIGGAYVRRLLSASDERPQSIADPAGFTVAGLAEPLTPREVEILRLIAAGMRNQEIADQLVISLSTVKRHIANAYGKLGVDHRTEAVARLTI